MLDEKPDLNSAIRIEIILTNGATIIFKRGSDDEYHTWTGSYNSWQYPFTSDELSQIIDWLSVNDASLKIYKRLNIQTGIGIEMNGGEYKINTPLDSIPTPEKLTTTVLGKMFRLTSRYTGADYG